MIAVALSLSRFTMFPNLTYTYQSSAKDTRGRGVRLLSLQQLRRAPSQVQQVLSHFFIHACNAEHGQLIDGHSV